MKIKYKHNTNNQYIYIQNNIHKNIHKNIVNVTIILKEMVYILNN